MSEYVIPAIVGIWRDEMDAEPGVNGDGSMGFTVVLRDPAVLLTITTDVMGIDPELRLVRQPDDGQAISVPLPSEASHWLLEVLRLRRRSDPPPFPGNRARARACPSIVPTSKRRMNQMPYYITNFSGDDPHLIGPFTSDEEAANYTNKTWNIVELAKPEIRLVAPTAEMHKEVLREQQSWNEPPLEEEALESPPETSRGGLTDGAAAGENATSGVPGGSGGPSGGEKP
jgi:hypothetical protein